MIKKFKNTYIKDNFLIKNFLKYVSIILLFYAIYLKIFWYKKNNNLFILTFPIIIFLIIEVIISFSKEKLVIQDKKIILYEYFLNFNYKKIEISFYNIIDIYWEDESKYCDSTIPIPKIIFKNIKIRVKNKEFEDKIYAFGYKMKEDECLEIIEELKEIINFHKINYKKK